MPTISERARVALRQGDTDLFISHVTGENINDSFTAAASYGNIEALNILLARSPDNAACQNMIHAFDDLAFRSAAREGYLDVINLLLEMNTGELARHNMIHANGDEAFRSAAQQGHLDVINLLLESTPAPIERHNMIHARNDKAFSSAAARGHLHVINLLRELTTDEVARHNMIHANGDEAFRSAAQEGHLDVINLLLESTPAPAERHNMIHANGDEAFSSAAARGDLGVINLLLELTPVPAERRNMIHSRNDQTFRFAVILGRLNVINRLIELTPADEIDTESGLNRRSQMINLAAELGGDYHDIDKISNVGNAKTFLSVILEENPHFPSLNDTKIEKLRQFKTKLVEQFSQTSNVVERLSANDAANRVIAELLDNRQEKLKTSKFLTNQRLVSKQGIKEMRSQQVQLFPETIDEISSFLTTIRFSEKIPPRHQEISNAALEEIFCRPNHVVLPSTAQSLNFGRNNANDKSGIS